MISSFGKKLLTIKYDELKLSSFSLIIIIILSIDCKVLYQFILCNRIFVPPANTEGKPRGFFGCMLNENNREIIVRYNSVVCISVVINDIG